VIIRIKIEILKVFNLEFDFNSKGKDDVEEIDSSAGDDVQPGNSN
jgi:hypothetical protein